MVLAIEMAEKSTKPPFHQTQCIASYSVAHRLVLRFSFAAASSATFGFLFFPVLINRIMTVCFLQPFHLLSTLLFCPASSTLLARFLPLSLSMCPYVYCCCYSECGERKKIVLVSFFFFDFCAFHSTSRLRLLCIFLFRYLKCVPNILFSFFIFCALAGIMGYMCACLMNKCICVHQFVRGIECVSVGFCVLLEFTMRFFFVDHC